ncbi:MAG: phosphodiesterase [Treponema sp.]|nr:phosphodiesterase [Treponema sp.]
MKYFIISDVHGSAAACRKALAQFSALSCDRIILLGDVLYHGPRNPLPEEYAPSAVAEMLNQLTGNILACRGNCDSEVDQMVLSFPIMSDYICIDVDGMQLFASHGHIYSPEKNADSTHIDASLANVSHLNTVECTPIVGGSRLPPLSKNHIVLFGHIHEQHLYKTKDGILVCNPGSPSLPKNDSRAGFAVYENGCITLYDIDGNAQLSQCVN